MNRRTDDSSSRQALEDQVFEMMEARQTVPQELRDKRARLLRVFSEKQPASPARDDRNPREPKK